MSGKKHPLTEHEYEIYRKIHAYDDPVEVEQGKIDHEKSNYLEKRTKGKRKTNRMLRNITGDILTVDEALFDDDDFIARRELKDARVHKQRLKSIKKFENEV